jgi:AraC family transcriptional regulator, transcriptional activator of pobA
MNMNKLLTSHPPLAFDIHRLSAHHTRYPNFIKKRLQNTYELIFIMDGGGYHIIDDQQYLLKRGSVYCVTPGYERSSVLTAAAVGYVMSFSENFLNTDKGDPECLPDAIMFTQLRNNPELEMETDAFEEIGDVLQLLLNEFSKHALLRTEIVRNLLRIVLFHLKQQIKYNMGFKLEDPCHHLVNNFFFLLENNFWENREVGYYARELFVTPNYLNHCIKKSTGFPARYHISQRIIREAKRKAGYGEITLKQISYMLGFEDACHFSRFFKKGTGYNFTQYKKMQLSHTGLF